ncbi:MAG: hypothetical protein M3332_14265 [Actinomycetota bacterium]|nr:hypothetical protein [Actinomycetota bacterium]
MTRHAWRRDAPQALYAVDNHVNSGPYRTIFEIAEVTVNEAAGAVGS